ncbi:T9SS type A sorting domain-containing protein [Flammeovirga sp. EKP202]|uniref:T9SS type A sorting domain-containing protein n=1 Tax=Flammeovirga sp. EKP202 TaxID=2770592 RepID=UPI00165FEB4F|nr:T9SS type A sorting domain-containing protein [Flammeovirga sp. EKP202]MBD0401531.1 T9SS type A sorting domain-containing protein [Flammeovirga sp. EKP202]
MNKTTTTLIFSLLIPLFVRAQMDQAFFSSLKGERMSSNNKITWSQFGPENIFLIKKEGTPKYQPVDQTIQITSLTPKQNINLHSLLAGVYVCKFSQNNQVYTIKLLKR